MNAKAEEDAEEDAFRFASIGVDSRLLSINQPAWNCCVPRFSTIAKPLSPEAS
jgi:hypothetical protein